MISIFKKLFDNEYKELKRFNEIATKIDALDEEYSKLTDKIVSIGVIVGPEGGSDKSDMDILNKADNMT